MHLGKKPALRFVAAIASLAVIGAAVAGCTSSSNAKSDTLTIWTFKKEWIPGIEAAAAAYKKKTGTDVTVKVDYFDEANGVYSSKVSAAARSKTLPDLLTAYGSQWDYVGGNLYKKLNGKLDDTLKNIPSSLVDSFVKFNSADQATCKANPDCTYGSVKVGDYYTLPQISGATGYFYANKTLLQSAGVNLDKAPSSWGDLVADIQKSHAALGDKGGVALPLKIPETGWLWLLRPMLFTQLGKEATDALFADKSGKAWQDPKVIKALSLYDQLSPYWIPSVLQDGIEETDQAFVSGNAAWYYGGTFSLAGLAQKGMDTSKLAIFPMPVAAGGALSQLKLTPWASGPLGVSKDAKNEQGAIDFLKFYMSPDGAQAFASKVADTPAVTLPAGSSTGNPALVQATKESFGSGDDAYNEFTTYGPTCDAAKTLNNQAAVALTGLVTKQTTPEKLGSTLAELYQKAWSACG
jgi:multiple sugar transport system substrate-binding protein